MERWFERASEEQVHANQSQRSEVMDELLQMLQSLGQRLQEQDRLTMERAGAIAREHGQQRSHLRWDVVELVRDYEILHGVVLEHLGRVVDERLTYRQAMVIATVISRVIGSAVEAFNESAQQRLKERDEQLQERTAQLRQRERELTHLDRLAIMGQMASGFGHELNQPLTTIVTYAEGLTVQLQDNPKALDAHAVKEALAHIAHQGRRAGTIIRTLREFSRSDRDDSSRFSLNELIHEAVELSHSDLQFAEIQVVLDLDETLPEIFASRVEVEQVLLKLIRNAIEAIGKMPSQQRILMLTTRQIDEEHVRITVRDNGPGLPPEELGQIFHPFFTTKADRTGIGLNVCEYIVAHHQGRIWAENNDDHGLSVHVKLPIDSQDA